MSRTSRPIAVVAGAILAIVAGVLGIVSIAAYAGLYVGGSFAIIFLADLAIAIAFLIAGYGLWRLRPWAWMLTLVLSIIMFATGVLALVGGDLVTGVIQIALPGALVYCLNRPDVRRVTGRG